MNVTLRPTIISEKSILRNLLELYMYDFTKFDPEDVNEHGLYEYEYLDHYWTEEGRYPFIVRVDEKLAGFVLVRTIISGNRHIYSMAEFFIMKKYRGYGIGRKVAHDVFEQLPGEWKVREIESNIPAQAFWRKVIAEYTNNEYKEIREEGWEGPIQTFKSGIGRREE